MHSYLSAVIYVQRYMHIYLSAAFMCNDWCEVTFMQLVMCNHWYPDICDELLMWHYLCASFLCADCAIFPVALQSVYLFSHPPTHTSFYADIWEMIKDWKSWQSAICFPSIRKNSISVCVFVCVIACTSIWHSTFTL